MDIMQMVYSISILTGMQDNITFINAYVDDTDFIKELREFSLI